MYLGIYHYSHCVTINFICVNAIIILIITIQLIYVDCLDFVICLRVLFFFFLSCVPFVIGLSGVKLAHMQAVSRL
jgi:hypothetical protein